MSSAADFRHTLRIPLRWKDNDVYGHVNNVEYYSFFDTVINEYLVTAGGLDILGGDAIGVCAESHCKYEAAVAFPGVVLAGLRVGDLGRSSVRYEIGLFAAAAAGEQLLADGWFVHVFVDRCSRRPVPIPAGIRAALAELT